MICKVIMLAVFLAVVAAEHHDYYTHPKYEWEYKVDDPHTHDHKIHHENRDGGNVENVYSVHKDEDKHGSFHTSVKRYFHHIEPVHHHHH